MARPNGSAGRVPLWKAGVPSDPSVASWQTTRSDSQRRLSFAARTTISFALTAVMTVSLLVIVLSYAWEQQFNSYTRSNMESLAQVAAHDIASAYESDGAWTPELVADLGSIVSVTSDVGVQVLDADGTILYDDTWGEEKATGYAPGGSPSSGRRVSLAPTESESSVAVDIVDSSGRSVGTVRLWAFGSDALLTKSDEEFRENSYAAILVVSVVATVLACVIGAIVAHSLTRPLKRITSAAASLRSGNLSARSNVRGADEIGQLGETFDDMATSLERDLKLEHQLTSDVAHELRTPLMALQATVEAMQDGVMPCDDENLAVVGGEVRRLSRLVDAMLQLSRMENGTTPFEPVECDVVELVSNLVATQAQLFSDNGLELAFYNDDAPEPDEDEPAEVDPEFGEEWYPIYAEVDRDLMNRAVTNLLSNALRYTPEGGSVEVHVGSDRGDVLVSVSDTGVGIEPEDLSRVFSRFWRSDASRERASGGLGIGLALTKHIADRHNGNISVESKVGQGSTFTLHIPREHRAKQQRRRPSATMES